MGVILDVLDAVDGATQSIAKQGFENGAAEMGYVISAGATFLLILMGLNMIWQLKPMAGYNFLAFFVKTSLVGVFAQSWSNFEVFYRIITDVPENIGSSILALTGVSSQGGLYKDLDTMLFNITAYGDAISDNAGWVFGAFMGVVIYCVAALFAAVAAGIIAFSKIVLTLMIVLAPFAIVCSMFEGTMSIFQAWTRSVVGYALMPVVAAGAVGVVIAVAVGTTRPDAADVETIGAILPFIVVLFLSIGIMASVPSIAMGLSGAIGLISNAANLQDAAQDGVIRAAKLPSAGYKGMRDGHAPWSQTGANAVSSATPDPKAFNPNSPAMVMKRNEAWRKQFPKKTEN